MLQAFILSWFQPFPRPPTQLEPKPQHLTLSLPIIQILLTFVLILHLFIYIFFHLPINRSLSRPTYYLTIHAPPLPFISFHHDCSLEASQSKALANTMHLIKWQQNQHKLPKHKLLKFLPKDIENWSMNSKLAWFYHTDYTYLRSTTPSKSIVASSSIL